MSRLLIAALLALLLIVGLVGGYALASIPAPDGRIYACYYFEGPVSGANKLVQLLDKEKGECPPGWTEISWRAD
jgi:hypothetical protein